MQTKLTLRVEDSVVLKAKRLARKRGSSVSKIFTEYISQQGDDSELANLGAITNSMIGASRGAEIGNEKIAYRQHLEEKHL